MACNMVAHDFDFGFWIGLWLAMWRCMWRCSWCVCGKYFNMAWQRESTSTCLHVMRKPRGMDSRCFTHFVRVWCPFWLNHTHLHLQLDQDFAATVLLFTIGHLLNTGSTNCKFVFCELRRSFCFAQKRKKKVRIASQANKAAFEKRMFRALL